MQKTTYEQVQEVNLMELYKTTRKIYDSRTTD
jgi:hypothetical protein